jgi:hypothetical protein
MRTPTVLPTLASVVLALGLAVAASAGSAPRASAECDGALGPTLGPVPPPCPRPDLVIADFKVQRLDRATVKFTLKVKNEGSVSSPGCTHTIWNNYPNPQSYGGISSGVPPLAPGSSHTIVHYSLILVQSDNPVSAWAVADLHDEVLEANENNNTSPVVLFQ